MRIQFQLNYSKWLKSVAIANANANANANMFKVQTTEKCNIKSLFSVDKTFDVCFRLELYSMYSWADKISNSNETKANSVDVWLV